MSKKLLNKTLRIYLWYSFFTLLVVAPLFYYLNKKLYLDDADEALFLRKSEFINQYNPQLNISDIEVWNSYNRDIKIEASIGLERDTLLFSTYYDLLDQEWEPYRELKSPIKIEGKPFTFVARINLVETEDLLSNIALLFLILISLLLLGLILITRRLSISLWKPFYQILEKIELFEIDKNRQPLVLKTDIEEFERLNSSINKLIEKNSIIFQNQREFIENAAHELQTPIAIFKAKIDTLIQASDLSDEQAEIIGTLNESVSRLNRLNKNLLLLSKIDKDQYSDYTTFSLSEIISKQLPFFTEQAIQQNIELSSAIDEAVLVNGNEVLSEILFSNLLMNAIRHNNRNGVIYIHLTREELIISNTGKEEELDNEKLFNRFSKSTSSYKGNGLGLAIVKKICDLNKWTITYSFDQGQHHFIVGFKNSKFIQN
jgi:signal transduction histidine kinase